MAAEFNVVGLSCLLGLLMCVDTNFSILVGGAASLGGNLTALSVTQSNLGSADLRDARKQRRTILWICLQPSLKELNKALTPEISESALESSKTPSGFIGGTFTALGFGAVALTLRLCA